MNLKDTKGLKHFIEEYFYTIKARLIEELRDADGDGEDAFNALDWSLDGSILPDNYPNRFEWVYACMNHMIENAIFNYGQGMTEREIEILRSELVDCRDMIHTLLDNLDQLTEQFRGKKFATRVNPLFDDLTSYWTWNIHSFYNYCDEAPDDPCCQNEDC